MDLVCRALKQRGSGFGECCPAKAYCVEYREGWVRQREDAASAKINVCCLGVAKAARAARDLLESSARFRFSGR